MLAHPSAVKMPCASGGMQGALALVGGCCRLLPV